MPLGWLNGATIYLASAVVMLFPTASVMNPAAMATQALHLDEGRSEASYFRSAALFIAVLATGYVVCGAAHLVVNYQHSATYFGNPFDGGWGARRLVYGNQNLLAFSSGRMGLPVYNQLGHIFFGASLAGILMWLSLAFVRWPLHPIGLLTVFSYFHGKFWFSVFIGWVLKTLILRYGGSTLYRRSFPLCMGFILGELSASVFWAFVSASVVSLGYDFQRVVILP